VRVVLILRSSDFRNLREDLIPEIMDAENDPGDKRVAVPLGTASEKLIITPKTGINSP
jgi:hypothetical protein